MKIIIIIPAYNEEANLCSLITSVKENISWADILVVNDASKDGTGSVVEKLGIELLNLPYNLGIGGAVQTGYKFALEMGYDAVIRLDGDGQHPPEEAARLAEPVLNGEADMAIGSRYLSEGNYEPQVLRKAGTRILSTIVSWMIRQKITDATSGFVALNRDAVEVLCREFPRDYPEVESLVILHKNNMRIKEVPVKMKKRGDGASSIKGLKQAYYMIKVILSILMRMGEERNAGGILHG
jgi:hypothetical protein